MTTAGGTRTSPLEGGKALCRRVPVLRGCFSAFFCLHLFSLCSAHTLEGNHRARMQCSTVNKFCPCHHLFCCLIAEHVIQIFTRSHRHFQNHTKGNTQRDGPQDGPKFHRKHLRSETRRSDLFGDDSHSKYGWATSRQGLPARRYCEPFTTVSGWWWVRNWSTIEPSLDGELYFQGKVG